MQNEAQTMTNEELVALIQNENSPQKAKKYIEKLWLQNISLIKKMIYPYSKDCGTSIGSGSYKHTTVMEKEDLMQQAFFGFKRAIEQYDPQRGVLFMTYASFWVKQSAQRHFMDCGNVKRIPVWMKEQMSKYFAFVAEWRKTNSGNKPPIPLLMEHLGLSEQKVLLLEQFIAEMNCQSLQDTLPGGDDITVESSVSSDYCLEDTVIDAMVQEQEAAIIWGEIDNLPGRQGEIIRKNFQENMSLKEIAEQQKVTFQRIQFLESQAFRSLKRNIRLNELKEKYGYGCSMAYHFGVKKAVDGHTSSTEALALKRIELEAAKVQNINTFTDNMGILTRFNSILADSAARRDEIKKKWKQDERMSS